MVGLITSALHCLVGVKLGGCHLQDICATKSKHDSTQKKKKRMHQPCTRLMGNTITSVIKLVHRQIIEKSGQKNYICKYLQYVKYYHSFCDRVKKIIISVLHLAPYNWFAFVFSNSSRFTLKLWHNSRLAPI